jgi:hypothetical protein
MIIFSILKEDDEYSLKQYIRWSSRDSIQGLFQQTSPVLPLLHWMEYQYFLHDTYYFKTVYLILYFLLAFTQAGFDSQLTLNCSLH